MADALAQQLSKRFSEAAALSLVARFGFEQAYEQALRLASTVEDDSRDMYADILAALEAVAPLQQK